MKNSTSRYSRYVHWLFVLAILLYSQNAAALLLDFEDTGFVHGTQVTNSQGVTINATNIGGGPDLAIIFDTDQASTRDPDLVGPWDGGNLYDTNDLNNILIIAENSIDANNDGLIDNPDDEGSRPAGTLSLEFVSQLTSVSFDLVDIERSGENGNVSFYDGSTLLTSVSFGQFVDSSDAYFQAGVVYGNNYANSIGTISATDLGIAGFNRIDFNLAGSGGIDNINVNEVPEPATMVLFGAGLTGLAAWKRRKKL